MRTIYVSNTDQLGKNICFLRRSRRISMDRFCTMYDIPKDMLMDLELGRNRDIYLDSLVKLAEDWDLKMEELIFTDRTLHLIK